MLLGDFLSHCQLMDKSLFINRLCVDLSHGNKLFRARRVDGYD